MRKNHVKNSENETLKSGGLIIKDGKILLVSSNNKIFGIPKGHLEVGETIIEGGIREIKEETGFDVRIIKELPAIKYQYEETGEKVFLQYYLYEIVSGKIKPEPNTFLGWFTKEESFKVVPYENEREIIEKAYE